MNKNLIPLTIAAALLVGAAAPAADARPRTEKQRIAALEKTVKRQTRQIRALVKAVNQAQADADADSLMLACLGALPFGANEVLDGATVASFQPNADPMLSLFTWQPVTDSALTLGGANFLAAIEPACVDTSGTALRFRRAALR